MPRCARLAEGLSPYLECVLRRPVPGGVSWCCDDRRRASIGTLVVVGDDRFRLGRGDRDTVGVADDVRHLPVQHRPGAFGRRSSDHAPRLEVLGAAFDRPRVVDPGQLRVLFAGVVGGPDQGGAASRNRRCRWLLPSFDGSPSRERLRCSSRQDCHAMGVPAGGLGGPDAPQRCRPVRTGRISTAPRFRVRGG